MAEAARGKFIVPNERIPKMIGVLNITFAAQLLILGLCSSLSIIFMPFAMNAMGQMTKQVERQMEARKKAQLEKLDAEEEAAKTDAEHAKIAARRQAIENRQDVNPMGMMDLSKMGLDNPALRIWSFTDMITGLIANSFLLASGIGLLGLRPWAWKMASWVAVGKIIRLMLLYGYFAFVFVPVMSQGIGHVVAGSMAAQGGPAPSADILVRIYTVMYTVGYLGFIVVGSIYPIVVLVCLNRPSVKAAFHVIVAKKSLVEQPLS
jgi:hypothetical protein